MARRNRIMEQPVDNPDVKGTQDEHKTFTEEELNKRVQSEVDRRVDQALKTQREKLEEEVHKKIEEERNEAARLAALSAEERTKEELKKQREELADWEKRLHREELVTTTRSTLTDKGLPADLAETLAELGDAEAISTTITKLEEQLGSAIKLGVESRLTTDAPKDAPTTIGDVPTDPIRQFAADARVIK